MSPNILKSASKISLLTMASRILGLGREQVRAIILGTSAGSDAFGIAFMIPNLFRRLVAEGAMTAAFIPVFSDLIAKKDNKHIWRFANAFFTLLTIFLVTFAIGFVLLTPELNRMIFARGFQDNPTKLALTNTLTRLMFGYIIFISLAALVQAILNSFSNFGVPAVTPILLNLAIIGCALGLSHRFTEPTYAFAIGVIVGGILQLGFQIPFAWKLGMRFISGFEGIRATLPEIMHVGKLMVPGVISGGVYQINVLTSQVIATYLATGTISSLQYSNRLIELTLGVFVVSFSTVILPTFSKEVAASRLSENLKPLSETILYSLRMVSFITIPASVGLIILATPIISTLFQYGAFDAQSVSTTRSVLVSHALGLFFIGCNRIFTPVFYAFKEMTTPLKLSVVSMITNLVTCMILAPRFGGVGIAAANSIAAGIQCILLAMLVKRHIPPIAYQPIVPHLLRTLLASAMMAGVSYIALWGMGDGWPDGAFYIRISPLLGTVVLSIGAYLGGAYVVGSEEAREIFKIVRR